MAKKSKRTLKQAKAKKKSWFPIVAPKHLGKKTLGDTHLSEPKDAIGRTVKINLMQVTGDVKSQSAEVKFQITDYKDGVLETRIIEYMYSPSSIKRIVRRRKTRVDDSILLETKDGEKVRIKPFLLTTNKVSKAVEYNLRSTLKKRLEDLVKKTNYEDLFDMVINYRIQREMRDKLSKIYPIKAFEIRVLAKEKTEDSGKKKKSKEEKSKVNKEEKKEEGKKKEEKDSEEKKEEKSKEESKEKPKKEEKKSKKSSKKEK